jgi:pimeloyl-ACP methyl ester carboxylesterase
MKDIAFREKELERWKTLFNQSKVIKFEDAGHFVQEEKRGQLSPIIEGFLSDMQA